tara:strand:+ start:120 stop:392 length:273 start_codon:yes stop_codon:yes gene_type:complete
MPNSEHKIDTSKKSDLVSRELAKEKKIKDILKAMNDDTTEEEVKSILNKMEDANKEKETKTDDGKKNEIAKNDAKDEKAKNDVKVPETDV